MQYNSSLLPIPYKGENEERTIIFPTGKDINSRKHAKKQHYKKNSAAIIISAALCLLSVFSLFLYLLSNAGGVLSGEKLLGYIASDFLGIDPSSDDRSIYEILMSGGFGNYNQTPGEKPTDDNAASTPDSESSQPSDETPPESNGNESTSPTPSPDIPAGQFAIIKTDLSSPATSISNQTDYKIDIEELKNAPVSNEGYKFVINEDMTVDPVVLIVHTHGTEAFSAEGSISYSDSTNIPRSEDTDKNIVSVGAEMARVLNESGVPTVHCKIMHDKDSYKNSYMRSAQTIQQYLKKYPSIKYVLDVHRDSVISDSQIKYKPLTVIDGKPTAQVMLVMGSDYNTPEHTSWKENLTLAVKFTERLNNRYSSFTRTMSLRASSYNQEYTKGSMLLEVGSCGNTLSEAKRAGVLAAAELSKMIKEGW